MHILVSNRRNVFATLENLIVRHQCLHHWLTALPDVLQLYFLLYLRLVVDVSAQSPRALELHVTLKGLFPH